MFKFLKKAPWKKLGQIGLALVEAEIPAVEPLVEVIQHTIADAPGQSKLDTFNAAYDASLDAAGALTGLTSDQIAQFKQARTDTVNAYVAYRKAESEMHALYESFRHPQAVAPVTAPADH